MQRTVLREYRIMPQKSLYNEIMQLFIFRCGIGLLRDRTAGDSPQI